MDIWCGGFWGFDRLAKSEVKNGQARQIDPSI
jgi:hypothetical protein